MTILEAISIATAVILLVDLILTVVLTSGDGAISTCIRCNKKFDGSILIVLFLQTIHRCDDNLI